MHVVVNWLWQGVVMTLAADAAIRGARRASASTRYLLWWFVMILVLLLPALSWLVSLPVAAVVPIGAPPSMSGVPLPDTAAWPLFAAICAWAVWSATGCARLLLSAAALGRVRRAAVPFPEEREARLAHWQAVRDSGRRARLVISSQVRSAAVIGLGKPLIAVSPEAVAQLTDEELDQVVLHEWAHVQRRDDYARLAQVVIRSVAGWHPAIWWIGRRLEIEREMACDDYAVNVTGGARNLAACLTKLAALHHGPATGLLAPGAIRTSQLSVRVRRLLDTRRNRSTRRSYPTLGSAGIALMLLSVVLARFELVVEAMPVVVPSVSVRVPSTRSSPRASDPAGLPEAGATAAANRTPRAPRAETTADHGARPRDIAGEAADLAAPPPEPVATGLATGPIDRIDHSAWRASELPPLSNTLPATVDSREHEEPESTTPWGAAAEAGISIGRGSQKAASATAEAGTSLGRGSQKAAVATAGFFTRLSRKIAGSF